MAATDAKTSPSNKDVQQTATSEAPNASETNSSSTKETTVDPNVEEPVAEVPTTAADKNSEPPTYGSSEKSEKYVLAKSLLSSGDFEQAMELIEEGIQEAQGLLVDMEIPDPELHECMGPFHYLYGTTLLYSIEESNDTRMTVAQTEEGPAAAVAPQEEPSQESSPTVEAHVEDMEIAWENLDTARNIVQSMLADTKCHRTPEEISKLQMDLAQILLREGDLQRMNGRYSEAIMDYETCLKLRRDLLPQFDRKIADAQYNLGLSYLSNSTELQKDDNADVAKLKVSQEHCEKGIQLHVDCARTLCGQIASLTAVDPSLIFSTSDNGSDDSPKAGLKTTGLEDSQAAATDASKSLIAWRQAVATVSPVDPEDPRVDDLKELLDEIQETVDEAERSQQAVREATQLKVMAQKAILQSDDGSTTQIGFGQPTLTNATAPAAAAPSQQPMMVVKKKKKRDADGEANDAKRARTE